MAATCFQSPAKWPRPGEGSKVQLIRAYVRQQASHMAHAAQQELDAHNDQLQDYHLPILTDSQVLELQNFLTAVRHVDDLPGFPHNIVWPNLPSTLRKKVIL